MKSTRRALRRGNHRECCTDTTTQPAPLPPAGALSSGSQPAAAGSDGTAPSSSSDPSAGDGMESLTQQAARLRFGRDLRLVEVRGLMRSSAPVVLRMGTTQQVRHVMRALWGWTAAVACHTYGMLGGPAAGRARGLALGVLTHLLHCLALAGGCHAVSSSHHRGWGVCLPVSR